MSAAHDDLTARLRDSVIVECGEAADRIEALEAEIAGAQMDGAVSKPRLGAGDAKPLCAVNGRIAPNAMCGSVIVGMKYCGAKPGTCPHQRDAAIAKESEHD